uniref:Uncharacterized protein n=1 Tax=Panagrolaimus superbus TaxID=310955 RepID=A0A914XYH6_9BILA
MIPEDEMKASRSAASSSSSSTSSSSSSSKTSFKTDENEDNAIPSSQRSLLRPHRYLRRPYGDYRVDQAPNVELLSNYIN